MTKCTRSFIRYYSASSPSVLASPHTPRRYSKGPHRTRGSGGSFHQGLGSVQVLQSALALGLSIDKLDPPVICSPPCGLLRNLLNSAPSRSPLFAGVSGTGTGNKKLIFCSYASIFHHHPSFSIDYISHCIHVPKFAFLISDLFSTLPLTSLHFLSVTMMQTGSSCSTSCSLNLGLVNSILLLQMSVTWSHSWSHNESCRPLLPGLQFRCYRPSAGAHYTASQTPRTSGQKGKQR